MTSSAPRAMRSLPRLSEREALELLRFLVTATAGRASLNQGLEVLANEWPNARLQAVVAVVLERLNAGESLPSSLDVVESALPHGIREVIGAAVASGQVEPIVGAYIRQRERSRQLRRQVWTSLAYPLLLFFAGLGLTALGLLLLDAYDLARRENVLQLVAFSPDSFEFRFREMVLDFVTLTVAAAGVLTVAGIVLWAIAPWSSAVRRMLRRLPLVGPIFWWENLILANRVLAALLRAQVPAKDAVKSATAATGSRDVKRMAEWMVQQIDRGVPLSAAVSALQPGSALCEPLLAWGERTGTLPEAIDTLSDLLETRLQATAGLLVAALPVLIFVFLSLLGVAMVYLFYGGIVVDLRSLTAFS